MSPGFAPTDVPVSIIFCLADYCGTAICHGPQLLVTAGVMEGLEATCFSGMSGELKEAGARYLDQPLVRDGNLITSRLPKDLAPFSQAIAEAITGG